MKALQISQFGKEPELVDVEIPKPGANQILVKMSYCPINPSDYMTILGLYPSGLVPPTTVGFEGSGVVHEVGDGCIIRRRSMYCFQRYLGRICTGSIRISLSYI